MNQVEIMDFFLQMQADFDLPDSKIYDRYFQVGWQNALLPYGKQECLEALQEYTESPQGVNRPRIANIVGIIRKNRSSGEGTKMTKERAWGEIETACAKGILWAGEEKKARILSGIDHRCRLALARIAGCPDSGSEEERSRGAIRALVRIASTDLSGLRDIKDEFNNAYAREDKTPYREAERLIVEGERLKMLPETGAETAEAKPDESEEPDEKRQEAPAGVPKYILDIIEKRKEQYRSEAGKK